MMDLELRIASSTLGLGLSGQLGDEERKIFNGAASAITCWKDP